LKEIILFIGFGVLFSIPIIPKLKNKLKDNILNDIIYVVLIISLFILSIASVASNAYNPFIYFNF
ncbi:MAG: MBOAT family protein, partial [Eubacterium sp.]|nr:MBOAT family protein [Eubacterium sp.]